VTKVAARTALELLRLNREPLARAIVRQLKSTVARYANVDGEAMGHNVHRLLGGIELVVENGDLKTLQRVTSEMISLRTTSGFGVDELVTAGVCFLPVLRRFLVNNARDIGAGLDAYEHLESVTLPMFGWIASHASNLDEVTDPLATSWEAVAFPASIEELEEDEVTQPQSRPARLR